MTNQLTLTDERTDETYEIPIEDGTVPAMALREIRESDDDFGLMTYDPGLKNTAVVRSSITWIDGEAGVLRHRGYPIEDLAENSNFLDATWLVLFGDLPGKDEAKQWRKSIIEAREVPVSVRKLIESFRPDADPMSVFAASISALGASSPDAFDVRDEGARRHHVERLLANAPLLAAAFHRHHRDLGWIDPDPSLGYAGQFLQVMFQRGGSDFEIEPIIERVFDLLMLLHLDHEQNCSTNVMRSVGSSMASPYLAVAAAIGALSGPLHGGANQAVLDMLEKIGDVDRVSDFLDRARDGEERLMGFGHRVYKNYDPRAKIIRELVDEVFEVTGENPLIEIAREIEQRALEDDYFTSRNLYPNVDFYSGIIYEALEIPRRMFPVIFALSRLGGWLAQWMEMLEDDETRIARPRQIYVGPEERHC